MPGGVDTHPLRPVVGDRIGALAVAGPLVGEELLAFCVLDVCEEVYVALEGVAST